MSVKNIQTKYYLYTKFGNFFYKIPVYNSTEYFREKDVYLCLKKGNRILYIPAVHNLLYATRYKWNGNLDTGDFGVFYDAIFPDNTLFYPQTLRYKYKNNIYYFLANKQYVSFLPDFNRVYFHIQSAWQASSAGDSQGFIIFSSYMNPLYPPNALKFKFHVKAISADTSQYNVPFRYDDVQEFDLWSSQEKAVKVNYESDRSRSIIPGWQGRCKFQISCEISDDIVETDYYDFSNNRWSLNSDNEKESIYETVSLNIQES